MIFQETENQKGATNHEVGLIALWHRSRPINLITGPIIYSMVVPLLFLDICVSVYQACCFPVYRVAQVSRRDFIIFDRQQLKYLDWVSKFHCTYCAYAVGVIAFVAAVIGRTEAYFCPIKHLNRVNPPQTPAFLEFEEPDGFDFPARLDEIRQGLAEEPKDPKS